MVLVFCYRGNMSKRELRDEIVKRYNNIKDTDVSIYYKDKVPYMYGNKDISITHTDTDDDDRIEIVAISDGAVGVDIENSSRKVKYDVASRFFTNKEREYIGDDNKKLIEIWQKKEAYGKSLKTGLYLGNVMNVEGFHEYEIYEGYRLVLWSLDDDICFYTM